MIFNLIKVKAAYICLLTSALLLSGCPSEEESELIRQNVEAHQLGILELQIPPSTDLVLRINSSLQLEVNALLEGGNLLMTESDSTIPVDFASQVKWSISDSALGNVSSSGLFTSLATSGSVTITAAYSNLQTSVVLVITDSPLEGITITPEADSVDVCLDLKLNIRGVLEDGNEVPLSNDDLTWETENPDTAMVNIVEDIATLSTYLATMKKLKDRLMFLY